MANQPPQSGSFEQILRCLRQVALSAAFTTEMEAVANYVTAGAFTPGNLVDANGAPFTVNMNDPDFANAGGWVVTAYRQVLITHQLVPAPPYPLLMLTGGPGRTLFDDDTGDVSDWNYVINAVSVATADRPDIAARRAYALAQGFDRLLRRNQSLGGLVQLIRPEAPPAPGGEIEDRKDGVLSGVMQRFTVSALAGDL